MKSVVKKIAKKEVEKKKAKQRKMKRAGKKSYEKKLLKSGQPIPGKTPPQVAAAMTQGNNGMVPPMMNQGNMMP